MQKVPKKSRPKDASPRMPTHRLAFGPGHRSGLLNIIMSMIKSLIVGR